MAGKIPRPFIDDLLSRVDIVDVVHRYVPLKKAGKDYQACCPFHNEKTPSFTVSQSKQFYHCFGCGAHGTAISFLMEYDNMGFVDAVEELAHQIGVEVPREGGVSSGPDLRPLYEVMEKTARFYQQQLRSHPQSQRAVGYLRQRGLSGEVVARFGIGYAPPGWDNLIRELGGNESGLKGLSVTGMTSEPEGKCYDRFRDRIMFPLRDRRGRTIAFGGRVIGDDKPKYLNSPETPLFHKGRELYGLYEAGKALRKIERLLVVEGYMDVVSLAQYGIHNAVATLGTATTPDHVERLFKTAGEIIFCFDGDRAGREAAWKAMQVALPSMRDGRELRFLLLPEGEDPDTLIRRQGAEAFEEAIANAVPLSQFLFGHLAEQVDMNTIDGRAHLAELARPLLEKLPPGVFREMMGQHLNAQVGMKADQYTAGEPSSTGRRSKPFKPSQRMSSVRKAVALLLQYPELAQKLPTQAHAEWMSLDVPGVPLLAEMITILHEQPDLSSAALIERWRDRPEFIHLQKLQGFNIEIDQGHENEFLGAIAILERMQHKKREELLLSKQSPSDMTEEEKARLRQHFIQRLSSQKNDDSVE